MLFNNHTLIITLILNLVPEKRNEEGYLKIILLRHIFILFGIFFKKISF